MNKKSQMLFLAVTTLAGSLFASDFSMDDVQVHGFISQGYLISSDYNIQSLDSKDGTFEFNEFGINFSTDLSDNLRAGLQIISRDFGDVGNNAIAIDWAYGDYSFNDKFGLRVGRVKAPVGFYNETRDVDMVRTCAVLPQSVYNETYRDMFSAANGAQIYGMLPIGDAGDLQYTLQVGSVQVDAENSGLKARFEGFPGTVVTDATGGTTIGGALIWLPPVDGLRVGTTFTKFDYTIDTIMQGLPLYIDSEFSMYTGSAEYLYNDWTFNAEGVYTWNEAPLHTAAGQLVRVATYKVYGGYVGASRRMNDLLELGGYYSCLKDADAEMVSHDTALTARFDINDNWTMKLEGHLCQGGTDFIYPAHNDGETGDNENWAMLVVKSTFNF